MALDLQHWIDRLTAEATSFETHAAAAELEMAMDRQVPLPATFILPLRESAAGSSGPEGVIRQRVDAVIEVVIAARRYGDATGQQAMLALTPLRLELRTALIGWTPTDADLEVQYHSGQRLFFGESVFWWSEKFKTSYWVNLK